ncbi:hypothetical protein ASD78_14360 [Lysobacter sp. Root667]|nr:hypothetical protein ASD78_14360 [Lysobacter sp. Root667]
MVKLFRFSIFLAVALVAIAAIQPFGRPLSIDLPLGGPPPAWVLGILAMIIAAVAGLPAALGLMRLRKWGRPLGVCSAIVSVLGITLAFGSPIASAAGPVVGATVVASVLAWSFSVGLAFHPSIAVRFRS